MADDGSDPADRRLRTVKEIALVTGVLFFSTLVTYLFVRSFLR